MVFVVQVKFFDNSTILTMYFLQFDYFDNLIFSSFVILRCVFRQLNVVKNVYDKKYLHLDMWYDNLICS